MLNIKITGYENARREIRRLRERGETASAGIRLEVSEIVENVRKNGDAALREYTEKFDKVRLERFELSRGEIEEAYNRAGPELVRALERAAERIEGFPQEPGSKSWLKMSEDRTVMGQTVRGIERVGVYIPGGTAYPSSVLMNIIPAKIAGVKEVILATPPFGRKAEKRNPCRGRDCGGEQGIYHRRRTGGSRTRVRYERPESG